jgi:general secretion pathway protein D
MRSGARSLLPRLLAAVLVCSSAAAAAAAERITLNMRNADIGSVLQWLADTSGKRVVVDPRVRGQVTILARDPMTRQEAFDVVLTAINVYGYTAIEDGEVLQVVPAANLKTGATTVLDSLRESGPDLPVNEVVQLGSLPAEQVATTLKPLMPPHAGLVALPGGNSLLITDTLKGVRRIARLARELDRNAALDLDVVPVRYASAEELAKVLGQLLGAKEGGALQIVTDTRVNALVMAGTPAMRARAKELVGRLDQPQVAEGSLQVVYLHYLKASELVAVLKGMLDRDQGKDAAPKAPIAIEAAESTNALVISAPPDRLAQIQEVVRKLDIRRAQVLVEAIIAEVGENTMRELGVEWRTSFDGDGTHAMSRFSNGNVQVGDGAVEAFGRGLTLGYFRNGSLRALVRALETNGDTDILSTPSIVTLDNQEAEILVGSNVPFKTGEQAIEGSPAAQPFTTIERQDVGLTLKVKPQINQGDAITLDILQKVETLTDSAEAADIVTDKRSLQTSVMLEDEDVLVLGGLVDDQRTKTVEKIPVLGSLPVVGALFRHTEDRIVRRHLMVFVRTRILTDLATAEQETLERYNRVRGEQLESGKTPPPLAPSPEPPALPPLAAPAASP